MTFSQFSASAIVPLLSRIVLCLAFLSAGYQKVFTHGTFSEKDATRLKNMGVEVTEVKKSVSSLRLQGESGARIVPAAYFQSTATQPTNTSVAPSKTVITTDLPPGEYRAKAMYQVALMAEQFKLPYPKYAAWAAAFTELIGGAMMLLGLFSRVWGLGLAIVMGFAFYMVTMQPPMEVHKHVLDYLTWSANPQFGSTLIIQLALFAAALGVALTGAGPLSLDRALFGGGEKKPPIPPPPPERPLRYDRAS